MSTSFSPERSRGYGAIRDTMRGEYPRFSSAEYERRRKLVYDLMDRFDLDAIVLYGDASKLHAQMSVHWISNYFDENYSIVLLYRDYEPVLFVSIPPNASAAMAASPIEDVRPGGVGMQMAARVAEELRAKKRRIRRLGIVDNSAVAPGLPHHHHTAFSDALPNIEFIRIAREYEDLRLVPSAEEMEWFAKGIALTDLAWEALVDAVEPGRTEADLLAEVHSAYMKAGGVYCFSILGSTPMTDPKMAYPHGMPQQPSLRRIKYGDVVLCEISGSYYGYSGQCFCAVAIGQPPDEWLELADFTRGLYRDLCDAIVPGATDQDIAQVAQRVSDRGWSHEAPFIHAWGTHFGHPTVGFESWTPWPIEFREGQLIVVEPNPCTPDALFGLQLGNMTRIGSDGAKSLHRHGTEFVVK